jgi:hypothetical protein
VATSFQRVEFRGSLSAQFRENVFHFQCDGITSDSPYAISEALCGLMQTTFKPLFLDCLPADYYLESIFARQLGPVTGSYASIDYQPFTQPGNRGGSSVSEQLCPCITLIPTMDAKSAGHIFMPAVLKADYNLNVPVAGYLTAIAAFMAPLIAGVSFHGGTARLVIYSRKLNVIHNISTFNMSPVIGYQRRRSTPIGT